MPSGPLVVSKPLPRHPCFDTEAQARRWWRISYRVDHYYAGEVDACGQPVVYKHETEDPEAYARRKATLKPHRLAAPILQRYANHVFRKPPARVDATPAAKVIIDDATTTGVSLDRLMHQALTKAQIEAMCYLLVKSASANESAITVTVAQAEAMNARPEVQIIRADCVVDWACDERGQLSEATVLYERDGKRIACIYTGTTKQDVELDDKGRVVAVGPEEPHGFQTIPLVRLDPLGDEDVEPARDLGEGLGRKPEQAVRMAQIGGLAESQQAFNNTLSLIREHCYSTNFAQRHYFGLSRDELVAAAGAEGQTGPAKLIVGSNQAMCVSNDKARVELVGGKADVAEGLFQTLHMDLDHLLRSAGLATTDAEGSKSAQSGVSRAFQFADSAAVMATLAQACADAEKRVWALIEQRWPIDAPTVAYEVDAGIPDFTADLADALKAAVLTGAPEWLRRFVYQRFAQRHMALTPELQREIDDSAEPAEDLTGQLEQPTEGPPIPTAKSAAAAIKQAARE